MTGLTEEEFITPHEPAAKNNELEVGNVSVYFGSWGTLSAKDNEGHLAEQREASPIGQI